jgi:5,10-methylene-tetrahydrofolate dehydrogenase/methenyl tetrahydrofolate cyclohydrolase
MNCAHRSREAAQISAKLGRKPGLAAVLVGDDPASQAYVKSKGKSHDRRRHGFVRASPA